MACDNSPHGLTSKDLDLIKTLLRPWASQITHVDLFGSRAKGNYRPDSDIDLVIHGPIETKAIDRLRTLFQDSQLAYKVDVLAYEQVSYPPLKQHMNETKLTLFTQADLLKFFFST